MYKNPKMYSYKKNTNIFSIKSQKSFIFIYLFSFIFYFF